jgi:hypothetical protein
MKPFTVIAEAVQSFIVRRRQISTAKTVIVNYGWIQQEHSGCSPVAGYKGSNTAERILKLVADQRRDEQEGSNGGWWLDQQESPVSNDGRSTKRKRIVTGSSLLEPSTVMESVTVIMEPFTVMKPFTVMEPSTVMESVTVIMEPFTVMKPFTVMEPSTVMKPFTVIAEAVQSFIVRRW